ncbi:hypothetical protein IM40_09950 (plasmid) [Candidatus Paracaedimonas acanthamoebae]|nr:hypothetical protein IM40_09950 [Candidatus Paracaedimonas acanthamoebae]
MILRRILLVIFSIISISHSHPTLSSDIVTDPLPSYTKKVLSPEIEGINPQASSWVGSLFKDIKEKLTFLLKGSSSSQTSRKENQVSSWEKDWAHITDHLITLNYQHLNEFFDYLSYELAEDSSSNNFHQSFEKSGRLVAKFYHLMNQNNVNESNLIHFKQELANFYRVLQKSSLAKQIHNESLRVEFQFAQDFDEEFDPHAFRLDILQEGALLSQCLEEVSELEHKRDNLKYVKSSLVRLYKNMNGGSLTEDSYATLNSLGIKFKNHSTRKYSLGRYAEGIGLLTLILSHGAITAAAALSPGSLITACSGPGDAYKDCASSHFLLGTALNSPELISLASNPYYQQATNNTLFNPNKAAALPEILNIINGLNNTGYYAQLSTYVVGSIPDGNATRLNFTPDTPYYSITYTPFNSTYSYFRAYEYQGLNNATLYADTSTPRNLNPFYIDTLPNHEYWVFTAMYNTTLGLTTTIARPLGSNPTLLWQRALTRNSTQNQIRPAYFTPQVISTNRPQRAIEETGNTYDQLISSYNGTIGSTSCGGDQTIKQTLITLGGSLHNDLLTCFNQLSMEPLSCKNILSSYNSVYTRLTYFFIDQLNGSSILYKRVVDGSNVTDCEYQALSAQQTSSSCASYAWNPTLTTPTHSKTTLQQPFSSQQGSLLEGQVYKVAELFFPSSPVDGFIVSLSQNLVSASNPNYNAYCRSINPTPSPIPGGSSPSSSDDATVIGAAVGGAVGGTVLLAGGTTLAVVLGLKYRHNNQKKAFDNDDVELGELPPATPAVAADAFTAKGEGVEAGRIIIKGAMHGHEYVLLPDVDRREAKELKVLAGLNIEFEEDEDEKKVTLGAGNFGRVFPARLRGTRQYDAMKVVVGTENVKASRREGKLQESLGQKEGVLPLLEYLHFKPTPDNRRDIKQLLNATFGSTTIRGQDMTQQELLLQVTPLAALGNGWTFQDKLALLPNNKLKDQLLTHFALSLLTGLKNMHDDGISHLDVKPTNVLVHTDGTVYVSDFGCALQKDKMKGGLGDFAYFSPDRMAYCRSAMASRGHEFEATETATLFSGKAADAFAAGITLLEITNNEYPLGLEKGVIEMMNVRDSDYFEEHLEDAYEKMEKNFKNLTIFPVIKGLLESKPRKRFTTLKAQEELLKLKPKSSPKELFVDFMKTLSEKETHTNRAININVASSSSSSYVYEDKLPSQQDYKKEVPSEYVDKLPSPSHYGEDFPSLYKDLQKEYEDSDTDLNSSDDSVGVPYAEHHNDNVEDTRYAVPNLKPYDNDNHPSATYEEPDLNTRDDSHSMYFTPKFKP